MRTVEVTAEATDAELTRLLNELEHALDRIERASERGCSGPD